MGDNKNSNIEDKRYSFLKDVYVQHARLSDTIEGRLKLITQVSAALATVGSGFLYLYRGITGKSDILILVGFMLFVFICTISMFTSLFAMIKSLAVFNREFTKVRKLPIEDSYSEFKSTWMSKGDFLEYTIWNTYLKTKLINYKNQWIWRSLYCLGVAFLVLAICLISAFVVGQFK